MNTRSSPWNRLVAAARLAPADAGDTCVPPGFATRVAALGLAGGGEPAFSVLFARVSLRALGVCGLLMVLGVSLNLTSVLQAFEGDSAATLNDPVSEWLGEAS